ncbi:MAG: hypothetical protein IT244_12850 [Bacteroidia bacterium]|nr:hypothetical protein [Bacteroidia bacterium]
MKQLVYILLPLLLFTAACKKNETEEPPKAPVYSKITILSPATTDTLYQTNDSSVIDFTVTDDIEIDTVFMNVLNPNGGSMYYGYFIVNEKTLHYRGYHKFDDGVTEPKTYSLVLEAHNSSKNQTKATRYFTLAP